MCRWQRVLTVLGYAAAQGDVRPESLAIARRNMAVAYTMLARARERLKRRDPRAWHIHTFGLALTLEREAEQQKGENQKGENQKGEQQKGQADVS